MHVFVSHASADAAIAAAYVAALEELGIKAWIAPRDLSPGTDYAHTISQAIRDASSFLLLCSAAALASPDVRNEFELAKRRSTKVIPVRLPGTPDPLDNVAWEYHLLRLQIVVATEPAETVRRLAPSLAPSVAATGFSAEIRVPAATATAAASPPTSAGAKTCRCGCGTATKSIFAPGHDARWASIVGKALAAGEDRRADLDDMSPALRAKAERIAAKFGA